MSYGEFRQSPKVRQGARRPLLGESSTYDETTLESEITPRLRDIVKANERLNTCGDNIENSHVRAKLDELIRDSKIRIDETQRFVQHYQNLSTQARAKGIIAKKAERFRTKLEVETRRYNEICKRILTGQKALLRRTTTQSMILGSDQSRIPSGLMTQGDEESESSSGSAQNFKIMQEAVNMDELIQERNEEIQDLQKNIENIKDILVDSSKMVNEQGEVLDRVDDHLEKSKKEVIQANRELVKAEHYQKKAKSKLCVFFIIGFFIAAGAILACLFLLHII